jgi:membrane-associated phospholipid phosphatase
VRSAGHRRPLHDWTQAHATLPMDVFFAIPYGTFLEAAILIGIFLYVRDYPAMRKFTMSFFLLNVFGFCTYHVYPAAPPWWFHAHGCAVDLTAKASEGPNLARVDAFFGIHYFGGFYGRSHDVFGAVPSLHVAYPLLILLCGWRSFRPWMRAASFFFFVWMCCAAVYLDHHWVFDVMLGITYTLVVVGALTWLERRRAA